MRIKILYLSFFIVGLCCVFAFETKQEVSPIKKIEANYEKNYQSFKLATTTFLDLLEHEASTEDVINAYFKMRTYFKKVEFLWTFLDREFVTKYINGAPLPKVEPNAPDLKIIQPKGLQCIDEVLFDDEFDRKELIRLTKNLLSKIHNLSAPLDIRDQQFFDASKLAVVRLAYVSASGFDVPGSLQPFGDMQASLDALTFGYAAYRPLFKRNGKLLALLETVLSSISKTSKRINEQKEFETFDRVDLIRNYLNPLFAQIVTLHKSSGFETYYEVTNQRLGVNLLANNMINGQLLDKEFFFTFPKDVDSVELIKLGKTLFHDPILSSNISVSCASCHNPKLAFSDGVPRSITHHGKDTVDRNAPGLLNVVYAEKYFYDLRTENLINQIEHVVVSEKEMSTNPMDITEKLGYSKTYNDMFKNSFGKSGVSYQKVALALASYVSVLTDFDSEVDQYLLKKNNKLSDSVYAGMNVFYGKGQCATCHFGPTYSGLVPPFYMDTESEVLGVPNTSNKSLAKADTDIGRFINIKEQTDFYKGSFKTTTTRNVKYTAPYMHNGVFKNLEEVVDFYNDGGGNGWGFGLQHQTLASDSLDLSDREKKDLIAFLNALSSDVTRFAAPNTLPKFQGDFAKWNRRFAK